MIMVILIGARIHPKAIVLAVSTAITFGGVGALVSFSPSGYPAHAIAVHALDAGGTLVWTEAFGAGPAETDDPLKPMLLQFFRVAQTKLSASNAQLIVMTDGTLQFRVFVDNGWATFRGKMDFDQFIASYEVTDIP